VPRFFIVIEVHEAVIRNNVWAQQDNRKIPPAGSVVALIRNHRLVSLTEFRDKFQSGLF
jgi:hypothetical protein